MINPSLANLDIENPTVKKCIYYSNKFGQNNLSVVNDAAERGVKLAGNFVSSSRNEDTFQESLQIIEEQRKHVQNQTRKYRSKKM